MRSGITLVKNAPEPPIGARAVALQTALARQPLEEWRTGDGEEHVHHRLRDARLLGEPPV
jgi:hypothetical protein